MAVVRQWVMAMALSSGVAVPVWASAEPQFYVGAGGSLFSRINNGNSVNDSFTETSLRPNLQLGVMRPISERWSLGTGVELVVEDLLDWSDSTNLLMWRIGELGYQISDRWALSFYGGAGRFYRNNFGYGYGAGGGIYYQLGTHWLLGGEFNYVLTRTSYPNDTPYEKEHLGWGSVVFKYRF
ncbi:hypothetical protein [Ferrimonas gelatinilytica]|uniref:Outer membrane protein beta-barrel domain-containing protein n=1 Tax=Ferrimonas gelatinilytica TaxID=1255257 RepID=A0ABP9S9C5_9GAMM